MKCRWINMGNLALVSGLSVFTILGSCEISAALKTQTTSAQPEPAARKAPAWVQGKVCGMDFSIEKAFYSKNYLLLRTKLTPAQVEFQGPMDANAFTGVELLLPANGLAGRVFVVTEADAEAKRLPLSFYVVRNDPVLGPEMYFKKVKNIEPYSMTLKFFNLEKGLLSGYIDLNCKRDRNSTAIKGYFYAQPLQSKPVVKSSAHRS